MADSVWHLENDTALLQLGELSGHVPVRSPVVTSLTHQGVALAGAKLLAVDFDPWFAGGVSAPRQSPPLVEAYVRGNDLIATYEQHADRPLRAQIYWRALHPPQLAADGAKVNLLGGLELVVSVQTSLLDVDPSVNVVSCATSLAHVPWNAAQQAFVEGSPAGHSVLVQLGAQLWYLEMIHPRDASRPVASQTNDQVRIQHHLFAQRLEKGVILRSRIRGLLMRGEQSPVFAAATSLYDQFAASEPPLTT